jgi:hypothetical protein
MTVEMTAKRWLLVLAVTALLMLGSLAARPALSISPSEPAAQIEEQHHADGRAPHGGHVELSDE